MTTQFTKLKFKIMFTCPTCNVKSISLFKKWKTFKYNIPKCSNCGSGYYSKPGISTWVIGITSIVYTILILYCLFNLTWAVGIMTFSVIIALEILVTSLIPLAAYQGQLDRTINSISFKEFIAAVFGASLVFGILGGFLLFPEYPIFRVLLWILCLVVAPSLLLWTNKFLKK